MKNYIQPIIKSKTLRLSDSILFISDPVDEIGYNEDASNNGTFDSDKLPEQKNVWE